MRRALFGAVACVLLVPAGCGERSCQDVADEAVEQIQGLLDEAEGRTAAELVDEQGEPAPWVQDTLDELDELSAQAEQLGCSPEQLRQLATDDLEELEVEPGSLSALLLNLLLQEGFGAPAPAPSPTG